VHLASDGSSLHATELIPWGRDALLELEFREGRYCMRACDGRFLHRDGSLVDQPSGDAAFSVEMKSVGQLTGMALRDATGKYLTAVGRDGVVQGRNRNIGKDELFVVEDSQPQVVFTAHNGKMASIKQGARRKMPVCRNGILVASSEKRNSNGMVTLRPCVCLSVPNCFSNVQCSMHI